MQNWVTYLVLLWLHRLARGGSGGGGKASAATVLGAEEGRLVWHGLGLARAESTTWGEGCRKAATLVLVGTCRRDSVELLPVRGG